jgi:hypothetical protein
MEVTNTLNSLLRGEMSAMETYKQALDRNDAHSAVELRRIETEHSQAADMLRLHIAERGGQPAETSGAWGLWAKAAAGTAQFFGEEAALRTLKRGEEHGVEVYERAMQDANLDPECRMLIRYTLIPQTLAHMSILDRLIHER